MVALRDETAYLVQAPYPPRKVPTSNTPPWAPTTASLGDAQQRPRGHLLEHHPDVQQSSNTSVPICVAQAVDSSRAVCVEPYQEMVDQGVAELRRKFRGVEGGKEFVSLAGETSTDLRLLEKGDVIVCTLSQVGVPDEFLVR